MILTLQIYLLREALIFSIPLKTTKFIAMQKTVQFHDISIPDSLKMYDGQ